MQQLVLYARCVHANLFTRLWVSLMSTGLAFYGLALMTPSRVFVAIGAVFLTIGIVGFVLVGCAIDTYVEYCRARKSLGTAHQRGIMSYHALQNHSQVAGIELAAHDLGVTVWRAEMYTS